MLLHFVAKTILLQFLYFAVHILKSKQTCNGWKACDLRPGYLLGLYLYNICGCFCREDGQKKSVENWLNHGGGTELLKGKKVIENNHNSWTRHNNCSQ